MRNNLCGIFQNIYLFLKIYITNITSRCVYQKKFFETKIDRNSITFYNDQHPSRKPYDFVM